MKQFIFGSLLLLSLSATAQKNLKFSLGGELGAVTGDLGKIYSLAIGGTGQVDITLAPELALTLNSGIIALTGKDIPGTNLKYKSTGLIPLLAGIKYYFRPNLYGSGQLGTSVSTSNNGGSTFTYAPGIGYKFSDKVDALLKYTGYSESGGTFGIRMAYTF